MFTKRSSTLKQTCGFQRLLLKLGPGPWNRTLQNLDPEKPGHWKTWTLRNLDPEKPGPRKAWTLKNLDPEMPEPCKTWTVQNLDPEKSGPRKLWTLCLKLKVWVSSFLNIRDSCLEVFLKSLQNSLKNIKNIRDAIFNLTFQVKKTFYWKETPAYVVSSEFRRSFKNTYFTERRQTATSETSSKNESNITR